MTTLAPSPESESQSRRRILIYSEFRVLLDALHGALREDFEVGTIHDRDAFLSAVADIEADAAVVGLDTSVPDSLEALKVALGSRPNLPVMLLSTSGISVSPRRAGRLGAKAHCDASQPLPQFISCLRRVLDGECLIPKPGQPVSSARPYSTVRERLTARQVEVLKLIEWWGSERHREHARYIGQDGGVPSRRYHGSTRTPFDGTTDAICPRKRNLLTCVTVGRLEPDLAIQSAAITRNDALRFHRS